VSDKGAIERFCRDVPTVLFDSNIDGIGDAFVGSDNTSFVNQTVDYLCRSGEPPCFFEMRRPANPNANKRRLAYLAAMERHGQAPQVVSIEGDGWGFEEIGRQGAHSAIAAGDFRTNTVLCSNDRLAIGVLSAFYERGIPVGRGPDCRYRVASHDDHPFSRFTCPALTTAAHDYASVGGRSVETLLALIENGERFKTREETLFEPHLVIRASA